jgi:hypothetical protein
MIHLLLASQEIDFCTYVLAQEVSYCLNLSITKLFVVCFTTINLVSLPFWLCFQLVTIEFRDFSKENKNGAVAITCTHSHKISSHMHHEQVILRNKEVTEHIHIYIHIKYTFFVIV